MQNNLKKYITAQELADLLQVTRQHVYNMIHEGLPSVKIGACRRFDVIEVSSWLKMNQAAANDKNGEAC